MWINEILQKLLNEQTNFSFAGMDEFEFTDAKENLHALVTDYKEVDRD